MSSTLLKRETKQKTNPTTLLAVLYELGLPPFTNESVQKYKRKKETKFIKEKEWLAEYGPMTMGISGFFGMPLCAVSTIILIATKYYEAALISACNGLICFGLFLLAISLADREFFTIKEWHLNRLNPAWPGNLPEFVRQTITDVSNRLPNCKFYVDELRERQVVIDPFLVIEYKNERYYVEVWNEPNHTAKREI